MTKPRGKRVKEFELTAPWDDTVQVKKIGRYRHQVIFIEEDLDSDVWHCNGCGSSILMENESEGLEACPYGCYLAPTGTTTDVGDD